MTKPLSSIGEVWKWIRFFSLSIFSRLFSLLFQISLFLSFSNFPSNFKNFSPHQILVPNGVDLKRMERTNRKMCRFFPLPGLHLSLFFSIFSLRKEKEWGEKMRTFCDCVFFGRTSHQSISIFLPSYFKRERKKKR